MTFKDEVTKILEPVFAYGIDWEEFKDQSDDDHNVSTFAGRIKSEFLAEALQALTDLHESEVRKARIDDLERLQESFGERGIVTFDMSYDEEAEAVAIANVLNKITDRIKALTTNTGGQE